MLTKKRLTAWLFFCLKMMAIEHVHYLYHAPQSTSVEFCTVSSFPTVRAVINFVQFSSLHKWLAFSECTKNEGVYISQIWPGRHVRKFYSSLNSVLSNWAPRQFAMLILEDGLHWNHEHQNEITTDPRVGFQRTIEAVGGLLHVGHSKAFSAPFLMPLSCGIGWGEMLE